LTAWLWPVLFPHRIGMISALVAVIYHQLDLCGAVKPMRLLWFIARHLVPPGRARLAANY
jgi:hypothetical protein